MKYNICMISFVVSNKDNNQTLEKFVKKVIPYAPLGFIYKLFRKKDVKVNGHWQDKKYVLLDGDQVSIYITDQQLEEFKNKVVVSSIDNISNWIIYEDSNILLINKPRGVLVQKDSSGETALDEMVISYLVNKKEYDPNRDLAYKPAPAHRLDRNTAGIVIFGKNLKTLQEMSKAMSDKNKISKKYLALVKGKVNDEGIIKYPLKKLSTGLVIRDDKEGKEAITTYKLVKQYKDFSLVEITLLTGRTHQIRVHFSLINHPVVGDNKYGDFSLNKEIKEKYNFVNQFLIAYKLEFNGFKEELSYLNKKKFEIKLSSEFLSLLDNIDN